MSMSLTTADVNYDTLVKVVPTRCIHWKLTFFPFISNKYLVGVTLRLRKYNSN